MSTVRNLRDVVNYGGSTSIFSEFSNLRSHFATSRWGGRRYLPYVFTEYGAIMLANVLNSPGAVQASIQVVRAFVKLRELLSTNKELTIKLNQLEGKFEKHDEEIHLIGAL